MADSSGLSIVASVAISVVVGVILLLIEYRTRWFAKWLSAKTEDDNAQPIEYRERPYPKEIMKEIDNAQPIEYRERPYPEEIMKEIDKVPLLQRDAARNNYVGLRVKWRTTLRAVRSSAKKNVVSLTMADRDNAMPPLISCTVDTLEYPELKIAKNGHKLWIMGEISEISDIMIALSNCTIKLD